MKLNRVNILLAEDSADDVLFFKRAMRQSGVEHSIHVVEDGMEAISYLKGEGKYADRDAHPFPTFCILDLKMPLKSGLEVLEWLQQHSDCSMVPVIIMTSSDMPGDIRAAYRLNANAYFTKPHKMEDFGAMMKTIIQYWYLAHVPEPPEQKKCK